LDHNKITDVGIADFIEITKENKIKELIFNNNFISDAGCQSIADLLNSNNEVTKINLSNNKIGIFSLLIKGTMEFL
jgi:hypothetical protein